MVVWLYSFCLYECMVVRLHFVRRLQIGKIGDTPWMYPAGAPGDAFHIDINNRSSKAHGVPSPTITGLTFEDINVVSVKAVGHISGPVGCIHNLTFRNVSVTTAHSGWVGCRGVDLASFVQDGVTPMLTCKGCT